MSIFFSLKSVPELALLTRKQRCQVHELCLQRYFFRARATSRSITALLVAIFTASIFAFLGASIPSWFGVSRSFWFMPVGAMIGFAIGRFVLSRIAIPALRPFYREFIK
jgi:hypothetical protein